MCMNTVHEDESKVVVGQMSHLTHSVAPGADGNTGLDAIPLHSYIFVHEAATELF